MTARMKFGGMQYEASVTPDFKANAMFDGEQ